MSKLTVTVTEQVANVTVTEQVIQVNEATGIGPQGIAGVVSATAPVTYNSGTQTVGINAGVANGVATLDGDGKIPTSQLPPLAVNDTFVVASQAAMLALTAQVGDIAVRTDVTKTFILTASPASTLGNWQEILTPPGVTSITATTPLTGGTITSTGSIGLDQTALSIGTTQLTGTVSDSQLASGVTTSGAANKIVKTDNLGGITAGDQISATRFVSGGTSQDSNGFTALTYYYAATGPGKATLVKGGTSSTNESLVLPSTSGTLIGTGDTGTVTGSMIAVPAATNYWVKQGTYSAGDMVLYDYKTWRCKVSHTNRTTIPNNDTAYWQLQWKDQTFDHYLPTVGSSIDPLPRTLNPNARSLSHNNLYVTWFMATQTITITSMTTFCSTAYAGGGTPVFQCGIFQPSDVSGNYSYGTSTQYAKVLGRATITNTLLQSIQNFTVTLDNSVTLTAGTMYGLGYSAYASTGNFTTGAAISGAGGAGTGSMFTPYFFQNNSSFGNTTLTVGTTYSLSIGVTSGVWARLNA